MTYYTVYITPQTEVLHVKGFGHFYTKNFVRIHKFKLCKNHVIFTHQEILCNKAQTLVGDKIVLSKHFDPLIDLLR